MLCSIKGPMLEMQKFKKSENLETVFSDLRNRKHQGVKGFLLVNLYIWYFPSVINDDNCKFTDYSVHLFIKNISEDALSNKSRRKN